MSSQIDKFKARKERTEQIQKEVAERKNKKDEAMPEIDWNERLKSSKEYKIALELGCDLGDISVDSEGKMQEALKRLGDMAIEASKQKESDKVEDAGDKKRGTLEVHVDNDGLTDEPENDNVDWIKNKREFYQKYAQSIGVDFKNDAQKDTQENSLTFSFEKDGKSIGKIRYSSPNSAYISKDASLPMYMGLVKDALKNDLSIEFGQSLNDTQKAMLLGAVLLNKDKTYSDGSGIVLKNTPKIDINAEYFKKLPERVQEELIKFVNKQVEKTDQQETQQDNVQARFVELRHKIAEKAKDMGKSTKDLSTEEYRQAMLDGMTNEQKIERQAKIDDREKRTAARLGIVDSYQTTGKDGKPFEVKEDKQTKDLLEQYRPELVKMLSNKYGKGK